MRWPTPRSITSESDTTGTSPPKPSLSCNPQSVPATRNPQSILIPGEETVFPRATISSCRPASVLRCSPSTVPRARVSVRHVLSFAPSYPPTLPKQASIPSFHPSPPSIHPFIPSRPRLPPEALFPQHNRLRPIDDHEPTRRTRRTIRTRIARRIDDFNGRPSQSPPSPRTIHLAQPDDCATDPELRSTHRATTSSTTTSPTPAPAVERRISPLPASTGIPTGASRWLDRCAQWSPPTSSTSPLGTDVPP